MPSEDAPSYDRENPAEEDCCFDELAKGLADLREHCPMPLG